MKQLLFLFAVTVAAGFACLVSPFWPVLLYYGLAALRPQYLWDWALPMTVRWSLIAAVFVLVGTTIHAGDLLRRVRLNPLVVLTAAFGVLVLFSSVQAYNPALSQRWAEEYAKVLLMTLIAGVIIEHTWQVRVAATVLAATLGYVAYEINHLYVFSGRLDIFHYGFSGLDNNGAGMMLAIGAPLCLWLASGAQGKLALAQRALAAAGLLMILHAVMMSYSRSAMLAASVGLVWQLARHRPRRHALAGVAVLAAAIPLLAGPQIRDEFLSLREYRSDQSAQSRLDSWNAGWQVALEHPILGAGLRNSGRMTYHYGADMPGRVIHNQYIQIAADSGIPAAAAYAALVGLALWRFEAARRRCIAATAETPVGSDRSRDLNGTAGVCLALQTSLLVFAVNACFLSVETFELPWLLIALGGAAPLAVDRLIDGPADVREPDHAPDLALAAPAGAHP